MNAPPRRIAHLDMDAFYASVELLRYPDLRGQPVVIAGRRDQAPQTLPDGSRRYARLKDYAGRGVITTSTYEARALGVFSAMGVMKAAKLAPDAVLLPVDFDAYRKYSRLFKAAVAAIAPEIEDRGIDEIYIDLSALPEAPQGGRARGHRAHLFHRHQPQQAAVENLFRSRQTRRDHPARCGRSGAADMAVAGAQNQRYRSQGGRKATCVGHRQHRRPGADQC
jgi:nucleotidyltransferase/DNA polymerase involved in DNA repair